MITLAVSAALAVRGIDAVPKNLDLKVSDARETGEALEDMLVGRQGDARLDPAGSSLIPVDLSPR